MSSHDSMLQGKGFFASLFDISFRSFITLRFIKILYVVLIAAVGFFSLVLFISTFATVKGFGGFLLGLIAGTIFFAFYIIVFRLVLELIVVIFRIGENTSILVDRGAPTGPAAPEPPNAA